MKFVPTVILERDELELCAKALIPWRMVFEYAEVEPLLDIAAKPTDPENHDDQRTRLARLVRRFSDVSDRSDLLTLDVIRRECQVLEALKTALQMNSDDLGRNTDSNSRALREVRPAQIQAVIDAQAMLEDVSIALVHIEQLAQRIDRACAIANGAGPE